MPKPLPPLPPKVDQFMRAKDLTVTDVGNALGFVGIHDWFPSSHIKMTPYLAIARSAKLSLKELYELIRTGQGERVIERIKAETKATTTKGAARELRISPGIPLRIGQNNPDCRTLERAKEIADYFGLEIEDLLEAPQVGH